MDLDKKIYRFYSYFRDQASSIDALIINPNLAKATSQDEQNIRFYKKVLLITLMDTLAGIRYPKERYPQLSKKNQERFIYFLKDGKFWEDGTLVSIPFLAEHLSGGKITKGRLHDFVVKRLDEHSEDGAFNIPVKKIDAPAEMLLEMATTEQEEKVIRENQHDALLYRYRNYLVHESREPGYAMEVAPESDPYYHGYIGDRRLYLAYPLELFKCIVDKAIQYIEIYLRTNQLDPYESVTETTRW